MTVAPALLGIRMGPTVNSYENLSAPFKCRVGIGCHICISIWLWFVIVI